MYIGFRARETVKVLRKCPRQVSSFVVLHVRLLSGNLDNCNLDCRLLIGEQVRVQLYNRLAMQTNYQRNNYRYTFILRSLYPMPKSALYEYVCRSFCSNGL